MKYILLIAAICWPVRAEDEFEKQLDEAVMKTDAQMCIEALDKWHDWRVDAFCRPKLKPLTTRWIYVQAAELNPKRNEVGQKISFQTVVELGLRSDGVVVWR